MTSSRHKEHYQKAILYAERLLKIRLRSEKEIREKLQLRQYSDGIVKRILSEYKDLGLIDDRQFAEIWIAARLRRPFGLQRITRELIQKGIDKEIIAQEIAHATAQYSEKDIVMDLAQRRAKKYKDIDKTKIKQRVYGYLNRRGFHSSAIFQALKEL